MEEPFAEKPSTREPYGTGTQPITFSQVYFKTGIEGLHSLCGLLSVVWFVGNGQIPAQIITRAQCPY